MAKPNTKKVLFSLLIPCYGEARHLRQMLVSILKNKYSNFEIIICEQGTTNIEYLKEEFKDLKIIRLEQPSSYYSRIELYKHASGDYVWFLDDDDEINEKSLKVLNEEIISNNFPDCIIVNSLILKNEFDIFENDDDKTFAAADEKKSKIIEDFLNTNNLNTVWGKVFKRSINPRWEEGFDIFQSDDKLLSNSIIDAANTFIYISYPCYKYFKYRSHSLKSTNFKKLQDAISVKTFLIDKYCENSAAFLLFDGYQNIKSFLLNNANFKSINSLYSNATTAHFIRLQKERKKDIEQFLTKKDKFLFQCIINKNKCLAFIILKLSKNKKKEKENKYQHISLGYNCSTAYNLKENNLRSFASPFDWIITFKMEDILRCIKSNFSGFLEKKFIFQDDVISKWYLNKKYNMLYGHDFGENDRFPIKFIGFKRKYKRRIRKFYNSIKKPTIFYRYCYLKEDLDFIVENSKEIEYFLKKYNPKNEIIYIIDKTFIGNRITNFPKKSIICKKIGSDWNKLALDESFRHFINQFEKHKEKRKKSILNNAFLKLSILLTRQKQPYKYRKQYKHFDVY